MNYTPKQLQILQLIFDYQKEHGFSPTYAELAKDLGVSTITVFEHLEALERKGAIRRRRHEARSVEIIEQEFLRKQGKFKTLPIKGTIASGLPIQSSDANEELPLGELFGGEQSFVLRVRGNSMIDDHILDGDLIVLEKRDAVRDGERVVVQLPDGQAVLRKYYNENGRIRLQPAKPTLPATYGDNLSIKGVYRGLVRRCG